MAPKKFWKGALDVTAFVTRATMCCRNSIVKIVRVVGILLSLVGGAQIGVGVYFMLFLPAFSIASNIWTGSVTGLTGVIAMYIGFTSQARKRTYPMITLSLITLLTNVANLVIIQVGEKSEFLTEEALKIFNGDPEMKFFFDVAIWSSTCLSSLAIFCTFIVSQYLFCRHLGTPKKNRISYIQTLHQEKGKTAVGNRFFPPSRLFSSEVDDSQSAQNGLWIARTGSLNTWNGSTLGNSVFVGGGSLGGRHEVVLGFEQQRTTTELGDGKRRMDGEPEETRGMGDKSRLNSTAITLSDHDKFSTFRPKLKKLPLKDLNINQETQLEVKMVNKNDGESSTNSNQLDDGAIPPFLQNHPTSWMFLLPNVTSKSNEQSEESTNGSTFLAPVTHTSTEKLLTPTPKSKAKLKKPSEAPPSPPETNHIAISKDQKEDFKHS